MAELKTIDEKIDFRDKNVLVRIDADVVIDENGNVESGGEFRLFGCEKTINLLVKNGARVILMGHLGRPNGVVESLRMEPVARRLSERLKLPINCLKEIIGPRVKEVVSNMKNGEIVFLENLRFDTREEENDSSFAQELASMGQIYINDAFATAHREHASVVAITEFLPSYAGYLFAQEVQVLRDVFKNPKRPVLAAISGAKIETKAALLKNLLPQVDYLLTGGGVANMFIQAKGLRIGSSISEPSMLDFAKELLRDFPDKIFVPTDVKVQREESNGQKTVLTLNSEEVEDNDAIYDIGPQTNDIYANIVSMSKTCVWNGPMGKTELSDFQEGTKKLAKSMLASGVYVIVGGGDTVAALQKMDLLNGFGHVSTGGGAMIAFLQGEKLPAVDALTY